MAFSERIATTCLPQFGEGQLPGPIDSFGEKQDSLDIYSPVNFPQRRFWGGRGGGKKTTITTADPDSRNASLIDKMIAVDIDPVLVKEAIRVQEILKQPVGRPIQPLSKAGK